MKPVNVPNLIPHGTVLNANINSAFQQTYNAFSFSIQIFFAGTPTGTFKLQASDDPVYSGIPGNPANWTDVANSTFSVSAAGNVMWDYSTPGFNYIRVVYTDGSGGSSTATVSSSTINIKGF